MLQPAVVFLDPVRRDAQVAEIAQRVPDFRDFGDRLWMRIDDDQAARFAAQGYLLQRYPDAEKVVLPAVTFRPPDEDPQPPAELAATPPAGNATAYAIVLFAAPPRHDWLLALGALGAVPVDDLPGQAAVFRMSAATATAAGAQPFVTWWGWYHPAYAISFRLCGRTEPFGASDLRTLAVDAAQLAGAHVGVWLFDDADRAAARTQLETAGAHVVADALDHFIADADAAHVAALARVPGVRAIESQPGTSSANMRCGVITGVNQVRERGVVTATLPVGLDGVGETLAVFDSGIHSGTLGALHPDYNARVILVANSWDPAPPSPPGPPPAPPITCQDFEPHGSHVVGTAAGDGSAALGFTPPQVTAPPNGAPPFTPPPSVPRGVAPAAQIVFISANQSAPPVVGSPAPLHHGQYINAFRIAHAWGARAVNNSWEYNNPTGDYNAVSTSVDTFAWLNPEDTLVVTTGNGETDANGDGVLDANTLNSTCAAKNVLAVGATENVTKLEGLWVPYRTGWPGRYTNAAFDTVAGPPPVPLDYPVSDNANQVSLISRRGRVNGTSRVRPDIVAPGTNVLSTGPSVWPAHAFVAGSSPPARAVQVVPNTAPPALYFIDSGTSMAAPQVTGACALARQFYRTCYGQLRRPARISTESVLIDRPALAAHRDGCVVAWVRTGGQNDVHAVRLDLATLAPVGNEATLQTNVGGAPALGLARSGDNTVLLHRGADNALRLSLYDAALAPVAAFGTNGVVTLAPLARNEPERRPAVFARDGEIAVAWVATGSDDLRFQRFAANDGHPLDASPLTLGAATSTSATPYITHDGTRYAVAWARFDGTNHSVLMRFVDNAGALAGAAPQSVITQHAAIAAPHVAWDARNARYLLAWVSDERQPGGDVKTQLVDQSGAAIPGALIATVVQAPPGKHLRRAALAAHPTAGFALTWEDDTRGTQDAYFALLGDNGVADLRVPFNRLLLSDIPGDTQGASAIVTPDGIATVWHGVVRANPPLLAVDGLALTVAGTFRTQRDPRTPLLDSGRWVRHTVHDGAAHDQTAVAAAWASGDWFLVRAHRTSAAAASADLVRTNADGLPDEAYGAEGARAMDGGHRYAALAAYFTGDELVTAVLRDAGMSLYLFDANGGAVAAFGHAGKADLADAFDTAANPVLLHRGVAATFQIAVAYAKRSAGGAIPTFRLVDHAGATVKTIRDTANRMTGTARHGWFAPTAIASPQFIAVWHRTTGATTTLRVQLFNLDAAADTPQSVVAGSFTVPPGDARCAVLAPRPGAYDPNVPAPPGGFNLNAITRKYGVAFQHRAAPADRWQVRFITLDRTGNAPAATLSTVVIDSPNHHQTEPQLAWHIDGYGLAWHERPVAGGPNTLLFVCLDATGAALTAPFAVSNGTADVHAFRLVWNGRRFLLTWTETEAGRTRHVQRAAGVLHERNATGYDAPFAHPSSALVRATLINGATNIDGTALPNFSPNPNHGYGWGRMNLRQSFAPAAPVTFQSRDDGAVMRMRTARYVFTLAPGTRLLRVTLNWTDPPGPNVMNELSLRVTTPAWPAGPARTYIGNHWSAATPRYSDPLPAPPATQPAFDGTQTTEQVVIPGDPTLPSGDYVVEVIAGAFTGSMFQPFPGQPFALVFVGSGDEWNMAPPAAGGAVGFF